MDTIGDFCSCVRNAQAANHETVDMPSSGMRQRLSEQLKKHGYIRGWNVVDDGRQGAMRIYLKYNAKRAPAIKMIRRMSRPGLRRYVKAGQIAALPPGYGLIIISSNKGVISGKEAIEKNTGGEAVCQVW